MADWVKDSVIYQIYPVSFFDSNGDGIGDLQGIKQKLSYVQDLGANVIWLSPIYKSPFKDGGYDVQDYYSIDKKFGTMQDFEEMLSIAHEKGIRVLMDLVIGHTSDKHPWFLQSKKAKRNEYSDYYVWTNSTFASSSVNGMAPRNGNYMTNYYSFQPKLNYGFAKVEEQAGQGQYTFDEWKMRYDDKRLEPLKEEIRKIICFWLDKGVDGFRVDLAMNMIKGADEKLCAWFWNKFIPFAKDKYPDCCFLAEFGHPEVSWECGFDIDYFNHESVGYNELFRGEKGTNILPAFEKGNSFFGNAGKGDIRPFIQYLQTLVEKYGNGKCWAIPSGFHDIVRLAEQKSEGVLKCIFAFLLTFKNVPQIYYGDEIGIKHNFSVNKDGGYIRTGARTPMQWTDGKHRGFTTATRAYLPVGKQKGISVEAQAKRENSLLNTVKKLIALRKEYPVLRFDAETQVKNAGYPLCYTRTLNGQKATVLINPTDKPYTVREKYDRVLFNDGGSVQGDTITLNVESFVVLLSGN